MPPRTRSSAHVVRQDPVAVLPADVVALVFSLLPVHERLLARGVCRGWRSVLAPKELWAELSFNGSDFDDDDELMSDFFLAAVKCAGGELRSLRLTNVRVAPATLLEVVTANAASLLNLCVDNVTETGGDIFETPFVDQLFGAAPELRLEASLLVSSPAEAPLLLRRLNCAPAVIVIEGFCVETEQHRPPLDVTALASAAAALRDSRQQPQPLFGGHVRPLEGFEIYRTDLSVQLDAVTDMAVDLGLRGLVLDCCELSPASLPPLTRMLRDCASLRELTISGYHDELCKGPNAPAFCAALRASRLERLHICDMGLFEEGLPDGLALLTSLFGHPTLRELSVASNRTDGSTRGSVGAALAQLLSNPACMLETLNVRNCRLRETGMNALFGGACSSPRLSLLRCSGNRITAAIVYAMLAEKVDLESSDDEEAEEE